VVVAALLSGVLAAAAAAQEVGLDVRTSIGPGPSRAATIAPENARGRAQADLLPTRVMPTKEKPVAGNPLWAVPLSTLSGTAARPLFSPSRRPPPPVLAASPVSPTKPLPPPAAEPDHPLLTLLGTIVGKSEGIGVFLDETSHDVIRLKTGDVHGGWLLRSVRGRVANFERGDRREATLALAPPGAEQTASSVGSDAPVTERAGTGGNAPIAGAPPENRLRPPVPVVPVATKGKFKRTPREL
jgi:hypothetical protein